MSNIKINKSDMYSIKVRNGSIGKTGHFLYAKKDVKTIQLGEFSTETLEKYCKEVGKTAPELVGNYGKHLEIAKRKYFEKCLENNAISVGQLLFNHNKLRFTKQGGKPLKNNIELVDIYSLVAKIQASAFHDIPDTVLEFFPDGNLLMIKVGSLMSKKPDATALLVEGNKLTALTDFEALEYIDIPLTLFNRYVAVLPKITAEEINDGAHKTRWANTFTVEMPQVNKIQVKNMFLKNEVLELTHTDFSSVNTYVNRSDLDLLQAVYLYLNGRGATFSGMITNPRIDLSAVGTNKTRYLSVADNREELDKALALAYTEEREKLETELRENPSISFARVYYHYSDRHTPRIEFFTDEEIAEKFKKSKVLLAMFLDQITKNNL